MLGRQSRRGDWKSRQASEPSKEEPGRTGQTQRPAPGVGGGAVGSRLSSITSSWEPSRCGKVGGRQARKRPSPRPPAAEQDSLPGGHRCQGTGKTLLPHRAPPRNAAHTPPDAASPRTPARPLCPPIPGRCRVDGWGRPCFPTTPQTRPKALSEHSGVGRAGRPLDGAQARAAHGASRALISGDACPPRPRGRTVTAGLHGKGTRRMPRRAGPGLGGSEGDAEAAAAAGWGGAGRGGAWRDRPSLCPPEPTGASLPTSASVAPRRLQAPTGSSAPTRLSIRLFACPRQ
ncbi:uncharacterized protein LOC116271999 [Papio anubis]|uniref:uncharacterized protein LOC108583703 n=1 Tax=Papio anubis TaxID=9555 RepID=UPI00083F2B94|nr:uncharacterized protein LOC108583703 [Papio anubis]XP_031516651.1 uncharacterized protein LOC116271999 [Papio anubis]